MTQDRRGFLKRIGIAATSLTPIARALALPAGNRTGTLMDVEHVVILMQENRSFDHYFGSLRGVRGFSDPRPLILPSGKTVWHQPGPAGEVTPFHLDTGTTAAAALHSLDHSWKGSHARWKNHDAWIAAKTPMTMGYFTRADLPFYYALADAFTICDAYHASVFGPTNPNRMFLFTGTAGLAVGHDGKQAVENTDVEENETADPRNDTAAFQPYTWTSYAERLQAAGIDWKLYQEFDNYGDNALAYFAQFRGADADPQLMARGRGCAPGSNATNAKTSRGEHLVAQFAADVAAGRLPQVSWIVAPTLLSEHPASCPAYGEQLTARLIAALADHPEVWAKTVFILNYDENDGFFDHVPPPLPPVGTAPGQSTVTLDGETYHGEPMGLGPRVPMIVVSPWTKGGFVNSELFDHTSVIRFLEKRFGVAEPNITPWRRSVCGDLTSVFDFASGGASVALPGTSGYNARADAAHLLPPVVVPAAGALPVQEPGQRPARPLPYLFDVQGAMRDDRFALTIDNHGAAGIALTLYAQDGTAGPWYYTVDAGKSLSAKVPVTRTALILHGPNGFLRTFPDAPSPLSMSLLHDAASENLVLAVRNDAGTPQQITIVSALHARSDHDLNIAPGATGHVGWNIAAFDHWYDITIFGSGGTWRLAGHIETGRPSRSDPAHA